MSGLDFPLRVQRSKISAPEVSISRRNRRGLVGTCGNWRSSRSASGFLALFGGRRPGYNTHRHTSIWLSRLSGECRLIQPRELRGEKALTLPLSL